MQMLVEWTAPGAENNNPRAVMQMSKTVRGEALGKGSAAHVLTCYHQHYAET